MAFLSTETSFSKTVEAAFHACDTDHDGLLSWPEVERSVKNILPEMDSSSVMRDIFLSNVVSLFSFWDSLLFIYVYSADEKILVTFFIVGIEAIQCAGYKPGWCSKLG